MPEPFSNQYFKKNDITDLSKESRRYVKKEIKNSTYGFFKPHSIDKKNIVYKSGAQWMGASIDNKNGIMYVPSNDIPNLIWLEKSKEKFIQLSGIHRGIDVSNLLNEIENVELEY